MTLPNVVIAGAPKCGTTSVFDWLSDHPEVCSSNTKEVCYFGDSTETAPLLNQQFNYNKDKLSQYHQFFTNCSSTSKIIMEATPDYIYQGTAIDGLSAITPHPKIIFVLRKPSNRLYSVFQYTKHNNSILDNKLTFSDFINITKVKGHNSKHDFYYGYNFNYVLNHSIEYCQYVTFIRKWVNKFGHNNIKIVLFEDMAKNPQLFMEDISDFIQIDKTFWKDYTYDKKNESFEIKNQRIHRLFIKIRIMRFVPSFLKKILWGIYNSVNTKKISSKSNNDKQMLQQLDTEFEPYNRELEQLLNIDLSIWR